MGRSTIARILKAHGLAPVPERPSSWQTFLRAHWGAIAGADFFTTEVWTARGLVTYYTLFVIDLASRRVQILGCTRHPDALFMHQIARALVVRSIKEECLDRIVPLGERHFRRTVFEFVSHYHRERPHQGCGNTLLEPRQPCQPRGRITRRPRLGGLLNFYARAA